MINANQLNNNSKVLLQKAKELLHKINKVSVQKNLHSNINSCDFDDKEEMWLDQQTNLVWEIKNKDNINNVYSFDDAIEYVNYLNTIKFAEYTNWRLPSIHELVTLSSKEKNNDYFIIKELSNNTDWAYWSSTNTDENYKKYYVYYYNYGTKRIESKNFKCSIRCVRTNE